MKPPDLLVAPSAAQRRTALLVSVRNCDEAAAALEGGAGVVDVKEPRRGPLGRAPAERVAEIVALSAGRRPVTAAAGDWGELTAEELADWTRRAGAAVVKLGLPSVPLAANGVRRLAFCGALIAPYARMAPVLYADRVAQEWPRANRLATLADATRGGWLVIDTYDKRAGGLLSHWSIDGLAHTLAAARRARLRVVVAGRLGGEALAAVARLGPDVVGVRGAACRGGRSGCVSSAAVRRLAGLLSIDAAGACGD